MRLLNTVILCLLAARGTRSENRFRRPPGPGPTGDFRDNNAYALGSTLDLQWETDFEAIDLIMWHEADYSQGAAYSTIISNTKSLGMLWTVSYNGFPSYHDPDLSPVYFIQMFNHGDVVGNITCHYFNITDSAASTTSSSASLTTAQPTSTSTSTATSTPTDLASVPEATAGNTGLSGGATAGIAVGATLGTLIVSGLVGWMVWRHLQKNKKGDERHSQETQENGSSEPLRVDYEMPDDNHHRYEAEGSTPGEVRHEMTGSPVYSTAENKSLRVTTTGVYR